MPYAIFYCPYCGKSERKSSDLVQYDGDTIKRCCGSSSCRQKQPRSDSKIPIKGTCEKCKSSNQVIFEPRLKKVNPIGQEVFTNYLCADCYCQEEGISNPSPTNNKKPTSPPPSDNRPNSPLPNDFKLSFTNTPIHGIDDNNSGETCSVCRKILTEVEKSHCYFPEQPQQQAYCHSLVLEAIEKGENINVDYFSDLTPHSKAFLKALQQVKRGEDINVSDAVLSWEEKEQLNKIKDEVRAKERKNASSEGKDKGLPGPVIGIIVIGVVGMLEKSNIQVKELEDYLNQKLLDNNYSDWENQMKSEISLENQDEKGNTFLAPKEIELLLEEIRNTSENGLAEFFSTREETIITPIQAKDVYLLVKELEEKLTIEPTEEGEESLEEFTLRRLTEILEVNVEEKLTENSKKVMERIRSDKQAKITPNQQANLRKDIKEQFINHLQKLIEDNQIAREDLSEKTKRIFENDRKKWPFGRFENFLKVTEEIYREIKLTIVRTENIQQQIQINYWHDLQVVRVRVWDTWKKYKEYKAINLKAKYPRLKTDNRWYDSFSYTQNNGSFGIENDKLFIKLGSAEQLIKLQRELSRKKQGSKNYQEKKLELARKHEKISNRMKDRNHKLSRKLETGKEVIVVNPKNTTQRCSQCGKLVNPKIKREVEIYNCSCGLVLDRDVNAAKNVLYLAQNNRLGTLPTELV
ncbi:3368_t:CDS:2 [Racocetra fulgida]|uniref:3368_t:CDS:1 n=1 Tax=Racocetra fulgida TaxID=60492 RepID=A0A9N9C093_9GLOM|nr:3368_t:CDS:2 [Racocetra fulgida]